MGGKLPEALPQIFGSHDGHQLRRGVEIKEQRFHHFDYLRRIGNVEKYQAAPRANEFDEDNDFSKCERGSR